MGRPKIEVDPAEVKRLAGEGLAEYQIAKVLGMSAETFSKRKRENDEVVAALRCGRQEARGKVENVAFQCALLARENPRYQTSMIFWLKCKAGWRETQVGEILERREAGESRDEILSRIRGLISTGGAGAGRR